MALRLYHVVCELPLDNEHLKEEAIHQWRDTVAGRREIVSHDNEESIRATICQICCQVIERGERGLEKTETLNRSDEASRNLRILWMEEILVAQSVRESIVSGVVF